MGTYTSSSMKNGTLSTDSLSAATDYTFLFRNRTGKPSSGYFSVKALNLSTAFTYQTGKINPRTDALLADITSNVTDQDVYSAGGTFNTTTNGTGLGCKLTLTFAGGAGSSTCTGVTVVVAGVGYAPGDTLTVAASEINSITGASGTEDLVFTLSDFAVIEFWNPKFSRSCKGNFKDFKPEFITNQNGNIISGSGLIQETYRWSIPLPSTIGDSGASFIFTPTTIIPAGNVNFQVCGNFSLTLS